MTYRDAIQEWRLFFDGDHWGSCMQMWFAVADEIEFNRDFPVPAEWQFRPSPLGPTNDPDDFTTEIVQSLSDDDLARIGDLFHRYAQLLKRHGVDY